MTEPSEQLATRADELRRVFDSSFAVAPDTSPAKPVDLLAIRVGGARYAVRLRDASGIFFDAMVEPIPSHRPQLLGMAAFRGTFLPVFDLRKVLGEKVSERPRWTLLVGAPATLGLAFDHFDGHLRVSDTAIASARAPDAPAEHTSEIVATGTGILPVVHLPSVLDALGRSTTSATKEN
jgi:chemotaxis signal transduction protein